MTAVAAPGLRNGALLDGEEVTHRGRCWAARLRPGVPLMFLSRRQALMVLTDRRLLVLARVRATELLERDLVIGKRYDGFHLERVRRARPLLQLVVRTVGGARMVFEFGPNARSMGLALLDRLTGLPGLPGLPGGPGAAASAPPAMPAMSGSPGAPGTPGSAVDEAAFWGER